MFEFNGQYDDFEQVAPFIGEYACISREIMERTGRSFVYNDELVDHIPGIGNKTKRLNTGTHEDAAIYMLQVLFRFWEMEARILTLLGEGFEHIDNVGAGGKVRFEHVVFYPTRNMGGSWQEWAEARLIGDRDGSILAVLPKGKRSRGHTCSGRKVLVKR